MICACCELNPCECDPDDILAAWFLFEEIPNALREIKEATGSYPINAWNLTPLELS